MDAINKGLDFILNILKNTKKDMIIPFLIFDKAYNDEFYDFNNEDNDRYKFVMCSSIKKGRKIISNNKDKTYILAYIGYFVCNEKKQKSIIFEKIDKYGKEFYYQLYKYDKNNKFKEMGSIFRVAII